MIPGMGPGGGFSAQGGHASSGTGDASFSGSTFGSPSIGGGSDTLMYVGIAAAAVVMVLLLVKK